VSVPVLVPCFLELEVLESLGRRAFGRISTARIAPRIDRRLGVGLRYFLRRLRFLGELPLACRQPSAVAFFRSQSCVSTPAFARKPALSAAHNGHYAENFHGMILRFSRPIPRSCAACLGIFCGKQQPIGVSAGRAHTHPSLVTPDHFGSPPPPVLVAVPLAVRK
jgi:hypothetical protein